MQRDIWRLTRELKKETCPRRVLDEVERQIATKKSSRRRWRFAIPLAIAGLVVVCGLSIWRWQAGENARQQAKLDEQTTLARARVASQAKDALGLMGSILVSAGIDSGKVISERAGPPLQDSFEIAKNKIIHNTEL
jgi:anti-sigma factor RsiW